MKIISYNLNGIRSALGKGLLDWLKTEDPDVFCIQESKAQPEQIDVLAFQELGYHCYIHSAEKKGYSGVCLFSKREPDKVVVGIGNPDFDKEAMRVVAMLPDFPTYFVCGKYLNCKYKLRIDFDKSKIPHHTNSSEPLRNGTYYRKARKKQKP